jgi:hypothetical protein
MKQFLNNYMKKHRRVSKTKSYESKFLNTVNKVLKSLGPKPFHLTRGINVAVFDCVMIAFAQSTKIPHDIKIRFQKLKENPSFLEAIRVHTTDVDKVAIRTKLAREILFK